MFALGMHFRREKEKQEAEKRKARVAADRARKKTVDGSEPSSRNRASVSGGAVKATTSAAEMTRERAHSQPKRYSYPAANDTSGASVMTRSTDDFGKMHIQGPPPAYDSLSKPPYPPAEPEPGTIPYPSLNIVSKSPETIIKSSSTLDNKTRPESDDVEPKKVKKTKVSKSKQSSAKSPKLSTTTSSMNDSNANFDLSESATSITKNGIGSTDITPLVI